MHAEAGAAPTLEVEVVVSPHAGEVRRISLRLPAGATVADALRASALVSDDMVAGEAPPVGVWGRVVPLHTPLREHDRVEFYRPLQVDPKEARRQRYRRQKEARAGRDGEPRTERGGP